MIGEKATHSNISNELIMALREHLLCRRIEKGLDTLKMHATLFQNLDVEQPNAAAFLGYTSQWVDIGYGDPSIIKRLLGQFRTKASLLPLCEFVHLKLAEGLVALAERSFECAIRHFDFIVALGADGLADKAPLAQAHFCISRCERILCRYDSALAHVVKARDMITELGYRKMASVMQVMESWLYYQRDDLPQALARLGDAEANLHETDDWVTLGNIQAGYGRIALREGCYEQALERFRTAGERYIVGGAEHSNLAGCFKNTARAKRLLGLRLIRKMDAETSGHRGLRIRAANVPSRLSFEQLREEALEALDRAENIYRAKQNSRGLGLVKVVRAFLFLDNGDLESAAAEAGEAFDLGNDKKDYHVMAHARVLQSSIQSALYDEGIVDRDELALYAQRACDFAADALTFAERSADARILARAYIARGLALCNDTFNNLEGAAECCNHASEYFTPDHRDHVWDDFQLLKSKVQGATINATLRKWSIGSIEGKTFQQMTVEFEEAVIPRVWELEERKVLRAAKKLSISPKKVRRILHRLGLDTH